MAVVVHQMVAPDASGVLFTAVPVASNRTVCAVEVALGLSETLVSGTVNADPYTVHDGVVHVSIATKTKRSNRHRPAEPNK